MSSECERLQLISGVMKYEAIDRDDFFSVNLGRYEFNGHVIA